MARSKGKARRGRGKGGGGDNSRSDNWRTDVVDKADMHNERFEKYYRAQTILPDEEWDGFLESLRNPLPTTFRVAGSRQTARLLNDTIKDTHVPHLAGVVFEGEAVSPPAQITWYPEGLAWQFNVSKKVLRKSPDFKKFHSFLVGETDVGNISRQEAVSMLPPLFLEVEPHHRVMDMCAAPGSKTAQLLEALHANDTVTASSIPPGLLIANDSDHKRTHLLIHQSARLPSPALMVTNHDASIFPAIKIPSEQTTFPSGTKARVIAKRQSQLLFDRILCDVPCSGDGTMRKNPGIWKKWTPLDGNGLHGLQLRILQRAMRLLKKDGRIVYSTCSINPVENEAVVAAALNSIPGFELLDMSTHLPTLIHRPGLTTWTPSVDRATNTSYATYSDYIDSLPEDKRTESKMLETHWPPSSDRAQELNLSRCLRIYPHLQDTGGFFVAILHKLPPVIQTKAASSASREKKRPADTVEALETAESKKSKLVDESATSNDVTAEAIVQDNEDEDEQAQVLPSNPVEKAPVEDPAPTDTPRAVTGTDIHFKENPYTFVSPTDPIIQSCISNLDLTPDFPVDNILVRNPAGDPVRSLYMTNDIVKQIVQNNDYTKIRLMTCGTKVLGKQEGAAAKKEGAEQLFRVLSEGLPVMLPYIRAESIVSADLDTLKILMETYNPLITGFAEPFRSAVNEKGIGSHVVRFIPVKTDNAALSQELLLPIWRSAASIMLMLEKKAKSALSLRVFGEDITFAGRNAAQKKHESSVEQASTSVTQANDDADSEMPDAGDEVTEDAL